MSNIAIKAENISKYYKLGQINNGTLFADIQTWLALKRGKEDPHSRIGQNKYKTEKDGFWALKDINFEIQQGDRVGIIGRNGAGKSTLLKVISEITSPTTGNIYVKGRISSLLEVGTGFHPEMTGRENIYMNGAILGMKRTEITRKLDEIIAFSEIEEHIDTPVKRYSSGMYVRLAFAVAAHLDSEILIADEVLAVGDAAFQKKALGKMNDLSTGKGRTVLFVSHNMSAARSLCNKGIVLEKGQLLLQDSIDEAIQQYLEDNRNQKAFIDLTTYKPNFTDNIIEVLALKNTSKKEFLCFSQNESIILTFEIYSKISTEMLFGVSIGNASVYGVISSVHRKFTIENNCKYCITFTIDNVFLPNEYSIAFGADVHDTHPVWWGTDIANFKVLKDDKKHQNPGLIKLTSNITLEEIK